MCFDNMRPLPEPEALAASTKARSRRESVTDLTLLENPIQLINARRNTTLSIEGLKTNARTMSKGRPGKPIRKSANLIRASSVRPPVNPAVMPTNSPKKTDMNATSSPTVTDILAPCTIAVNKSRGAPID